MPTLKGLPLGVQGGPFSTVQGGKGRARSGLGFHGVPRFVAPNPQLSHRGTSEELRCARSVSAANPQRSGGGCRMARRGPRVLRWNLFSSNRCPPNPNRTSCFNRNRTAKVEYHHAGR